MTQITWIVWLMAGLVFAAISVMLKKHDNAYIFPADRAYYFRKIKICESRRCWKWEKRAV